MKKLLVLALALMMSVSAANAARWDVRLGLPMKDFTVTCANGAAFSLSEATEQGKIVVITLFASWCGPCRRELPLLEELQRLYPDELTVIALSMDGTTDTDETLLKLADELNLTILLTRDTSRLARYLYVSLMPTLAIVDQNGMLVHVEDGVGDDAAHYVRLIEPLLTDAAESSGVQEHPGM